MSGYGNHGTISGALLHTDRFGNLGRAVKFDGVDDYIKINDNASLRPTRFTISVWQKTSFFPDPALVKPWYLIARTGSDGRTGYAMNVSLMKDCSCFRLFLNSSTNAAAYGHSNVANGVWNHWVGAYDGNTIKIYLNGILEKAVTYTEGIGYVVGDPLYIGLRQLANNTSPYKGKIDDIRIYNRALSESEISALYHEGGWAEYSIITPTPLPPVNPLPTDTPEPSITNTPTSRPTPTAAVTQAPTPTATPVNMPPVLTPIGSKTVTEGEWLLFSANASDPDGDPLIFSAAGLPNGADFNLVTGVFRWIPDYSQAGKPNPQVTFTVSDGNLQASEMVTIMVNDAIPPELITNPRFDNGIDGWHCIYNNDMNAKASAVWDTTDYDTSAASGGEPGSLKVQCVTKGSSYNGIQLFSGLFCLEQGRQYLLTFKAKSSGRFTIPYIKLNQGAAPWNDYAVPYSGLTIAARGAATGWQNYAAIFTANSTAPDGRLTFFLGAVLPDGATFWLDTVSLKQIVVYPPAESELLANPGFDLGNGSWYCSVDSSAQAWSALEGVNYDSAPASYRIQCSNNGDTLNSIQVFTKPLSIAQNKVYQLTFKAKCSSAFAIPSIRLMKATSLWTNYAVPYTGLSLTSDWQSYTVTFTANTTAEDGRLTFFLGNALPDGAALLIDSLSLREAGL